MAKKPKNNIEEFDKLLPPELDDFEKQRIKSKQLRRRNNTIEDPYILKKRAYELIVQGYSSKSYIPILADEFDILKTTVQQQIKGLREEVIEQYEEVYSILRESIVLDLIKMKNESKSVYEKIKIIDMIVKITGLSQEVVINHTTQDSRTFIISPSDNSPSDNKKELE